MTAHFALPFPTAILRIVCSVADIRERSKERGHHSCKSAGLVSRQTELRLEVAKPKQGCCIALTIFRFITDFQSDEGTLNFVYATAEQHSCVTRNTHSVRKQ